MKGSMLVTRTSAVLVAVVAGYVSYLHIVDVAIIRNSVAGWFVELVRKARDEVR